MTTAGIYLHIPFCKSRCSYCDFATDVWRSGDAVERYVEALCRELETFIRPRINADDTDKTYSDQRHQRSSAANVLTVKAGRKEDALTTVRVSAAVDTIYFGGGTPSLLTPPQVEKILNSLSSVFSVANDAEITMEMNPATVTPAALAAYREMGVNRASFGVQTFNDRDLKLLGRGHDAADARNTFKMLRKAGFENISLDLIAGLPGQTLEDWSRNLDEAIAMEPEHISLYLLEIHEGTPLADQIRTERRPMPDDELAAEMYEIMLGRLATEGYRQYEISNFSKPGFHSRHNIKYWRLEPVYGFGVSAHSFDGFQRYANERDTALYVEKVREGQSAEVFRETPDISSEYIFLGLRLTEGIDLRLAEKTPSGAIADRFGDEISELASAGLVEFTGENLRLTAKGMLFSNEVFAKFV